MWGEIYEIQDRLSQLESDFEYHAQQRKDTFCHEQEEDNKEYECAKEELLDAG